MALDIGCVCATREWWKSPEHFRTVPTASFLPHVGFCMIIILIPDLFTLGQIHLATIVELMVRAHHGKFKVVLESRAGVALRVLAYVAMEGNGPRGLVDKEGCPKNATRFLLWKVNLGTP